MNNNKAVISSCENRLTLRVVSRNSMSKFTKTFSSRPRPRHHITAVHSSFKHAIVVIGPWKCHFVSKYVSIDRFFLHRAEIIALTSNCWHRHEIIFAACIPGLERSTGGVAGTEFDFVDRRNELFIPQCKIVAIRKRSRDDDVARNWVEFFLRRSKNIHSLISAP